MECDYIDIEMCIRRSPPLNILPTSFNCKMPYETNEYEDRFFFLFTRTLSYRYQAVHM